MGERVGEGRKVEQLLFLLFLIFFYSLLENQDFRARRY